jgi:hypothetical protein
MMNKITDNKSESCWMMDVEYVKKYAMGSAMKTIYTKRDEKTNKLLVCKRLNDTDPEYVVTEWRHPEYRVVVARSTSSDHTVAWKEIPNYDGTTRIFPW